MATIQAALLRADHPSISVETITLASPQEGEVLLDVKASGVCECDLSLVVGGSPIGLPLVPGHLGSGLVAEVGPGVQKLAVGDHVAVSWLPSCGSCPACDNGHSHLCETYRSALDSGSMLDGTQRLTDAAGTAVHHLRALSTWATQAVVPAQSCMRMPDIPFEISGLLGCAVSAGLGAAIDRARMWPGSTVAVFGSGPAAMAVVLGAVMAQAEAIIVLDTNAKRQQHARSVGATHFVEIGDTTELLQALLEATDGHGAHFVYDNIGGPEVASQMIAAAGPLGMAIPVHFGQPGGSSTIDTLLANSTFGSIHTPGDLARYAEMYAHGRLPLDRLLTNRHRLEELHGLGPEQLIDAAGDTVIVLR